MGKHASPASPANTALRLSNDHRNILLEFLQIFPQIFVKILALQIFLGFLFLSRSCVIIIFFWICILLSCYRVLAEVRSENTLSAVFANTPLLFRWCCSAAAGKTAPIPSNSISPTSCCNQTPSMRKTYKVSLRDNPAYIQPTEG